MSRGEFVCFLACLIPIAILPWGVDYWPSQDDPNHLALAHIFQHFDSPGTPFRQFFEILPWPKPYMLQYYLLVGLGWFVDLPTAGRILISSVNVALPLSALFLVRRIAPERWRAAILTIPLGTGGIVSMGFLNCTIGIALGLVAIGVVWGRPGGGRSDSPAAASPAALLGASGLLFLAMLAHPFAAAIAGFALVLLELQGLGERRTWFSLAVVGLPSILLFLIPGVATAEGAPSSALRVPSPRIVCPALVSYPPVCPALSIDVLARGAHATLLPIVRGSPKVSRWDSWFFLAAAALLLLGNARSLWKGPFHGSTRDAALRRAFLGLLFLYLVLPEHIPGKIYDLPDRGLLFFQLTWPLLCVLPRGIAGSRHLFPVALAIGLGFLAVQYPVALKVSDRIAKIVKVGAAIPRGAKLFPLSFDDYEPTAGLIVTRHAWGYIVIDRDAVTPYLFAGQSGNGIQDIFRPLTYARPFGDDWLPFIPESNLSPEDYSSVVDVGKHYDAVLVVAPPAPLLEMLKSDFRLVVSEDDIWLFTPVTLAQQAESQIRN